MSSNQMPSADSDPPKFHRLFKFYDPEVVAVSGCGPNNLSLRQIMVVWDLAVTVFFEMFCLVLFLFEFLLSSCVFPL